MGPEILYYLHIDANSGVVTFDKLAADRWRASGRTVGESTSPQDFADEVRAADADVHAWISRFLGKEGA